jgi:hypothetical protein
MHADPAGATGDDEAGAEPDEVIQLSIEGDGDLTLTIGGGKPDEATLSFGGGEIKLGAGQFKAGQRVAVMLVGPIAEVAVAHIRDPKTGDVAKVKRKHVLKPDVVKRVNVEQAEGPTAV